MGKYIRLLEKLRQEGLKITTDLMAGYIPDPGVIRHFKIQAAVGIDFYTVSIRQRIAAGCRTFACPACSGCPGSRGNRRLEKRHVGVRVSVRRRDGAGAVILEVFKVSVA